MKSVLGKRLSNRLQAMLVEQRQRNNVENLTVCEVRPYHPTHFFLFDVLTASSSFGLSIEQEVEGTGSSQLDDTASAKIRLNR